MKLQCNAIQSLICCLEMPSKYSTSQSRAIELIPQWALSFLATYCGPPHQMSPVPPFTKEKILPIPTIHFIFKVVSSF